MSFLWEDLWKFCEIWSLASLQQHLVLHHIYFWLTFENQVCFQSQFVGQTYEWMHNVLHFCHSSWLVRTHYHIVAIEVCMWCCTLFLWPGIIWTGNNKDHLLRIHISPCLSSKTFIMLRICFQNRVLARKKVNGWALCAQPCYSTWRPARAPILQGWGFRY